MGQNRWVSYIYRYRNNIRCENAGFIKVQKISNKNADLARVQIGMKLFKTQDCKCMAYLIYGKNQGKYLTDIYFKREEKDTLMKREFKQEVVFVKKILMQLFIIRYCLRVDILLLKKII